MFARSASDGVGSGHGGGVGLVGFSAAVWLSGQARQNKLGSNLDHFFRAFELWGVHSWQRMGIPHVSAKWGGVFKVMDTRTH